MRKNHDLPICLFLLFKSLPYMVKKVLFSDQISETEILMDLLVLRSPKSKNYTFNCRSICVSVISITLKQITAETPNLFFLHLYGM